MNFKNPPEHIKKENQSFNSISQTIENPLLNEDYILTTKYSLDLYNLNSMGYTNQLTLFNLMQESAMRHSHKFEFGSLDLIKQNILWVATRYELQIQNESLDEVLKLNWGKEIIIKTWSRGFESPFYYREFEIMTVDHKIIAKACASFATLSATTRKLMTSELTELKKWNRSDLNSNINPRKVTTVDLNFTKTEPKFSLSVNNSDLDINSHVSNTQYIEWVLNSLTPEEGHNLRHKSLCINYSAESLLHDQIHIYKNDLKFIGINQNKKIIFALEFFE